jgi:hypothetical protein
MQPQLSEIRVRKPPWFETRSRAQQPAAQPILQPRLKTAVQMIVRTAKQGVVAL